MSNRLRGFSLLMVVAVFVAGILASVQSLPSVGQTTPAAGTDAAQGQYLMGLARCSGCHAANFGGLATNPANPTDAAWIPRPKIAGLPMFSNDADAVKFLETSVLPDGTKPKPPMPGYLFHHSDAVAVVAYLRSLK
jgi:mono/diheme cytochrome c family protein